mmetsp:Transcript_4536/g.15840  ORF Transcript_4536/g.15840 Transcript_4536/m.15840 type:complete len:213 (-) Transcript_4536:31-669(-)
MGSSPLSFPSSCTLSSITAMACPSPRRSTSPSSCPRSSTTPRTCQRRSASRWLVASSRRARTRSRPWTRHACSSTCRAPACRSSRRQGCWASTWSTWATPWPWTSQRLSPRSCLQSWSSTSSCTRWWRRRRMCSRTRQARTPSWLSSAACSSQTASPRWTLAYRCTRSSCRNSTTSFTRLLRSCRWSRHSSTSGLAPCLCATPGPARACGLL